MATIEEALPDALRSGITVRPLGHIEHQAFALVTSLNATQQKATVLGSASIDLVLGPSQDGKTIQAEGLPAAPMNADQKAAFLTLIGHYTGLATRPRRRAWPRSSRRKPDRLRLV